MSLITDRKKLLKLAAALLVDVDFLILALKAESDKSNMRARSEFVEGISLFMKEAFTQKEEAFALEESKQKEAVAMKEAVEAVPKKEAAGRKEAVVEKGKIQDLIVFDKLPKPMEPTRIASVVQGNFSANKHAAPVRSVSAIPPPMPAAVIPSASTQPIKPVTAQPRQESTGILAPTRTSIYLEGAPPKTTPTMVAALVCGGALASLEHYPHQFDDRHNFMINFLDPRSAASFMAFSQTEMGKIRFPHARAGPGGLPTLSWGSHPYQMSMKVRRCLQGTNPARRVLLIAGYPSGVGKDEFLKRFKTLQVRFHSSFSIESFVFETSAKAVVVFSKLWAAIEVVEWHANGLFGTEFRYSKVTYGNDPSDRPIPKAARNASVGVRQSGTSVPIPAPVPVKVPVAVSTPVPVSVLVPIGGSGLAMKVPAKAVTPTTVPLVSVAHVAPRRRAVAVINPGPGQPVPAILGRVSGLWQEEKLGFKHLLRKHE